MPTKVCGASKFGKSCDVEIRPSNKSGFCPKHFYLSKKAEPAAKDERPKVAKRRSAPPQANGHSTNGHSTKANGNGTAMIELSESQLDRWWSAFDLTRKAEVFSAFLSTQG